MENVEYKAELRDLPLARSIAIALGAQYIAILDQIDTYYHIAPSNQNPRPGRLKKREMMGEPTQWIFYEREDSAGPKLSRFKIYSVQEAAARFGNDPGPIRLVVKKSRELYLLGHIRIHLDTVEGLGTFLEFEAMVSARQSRARCQQRVAELRTALGPALGEAIGAGYADLLEAR